jgi:hypothetical protein
MTLGTSFLGSLVDEFEGSYLMAAAAYNAGPNRPTQWVTACGDPRSSSTDPVDYIECIPISETRNYVMRVLEGMEVYRARLNGGRAPLTLPADLKRGGLGAGMQVASHGATIDSLLQGSLGAGSDSDALITSSTPVPNPPEIETVRPPPGRLGRAAKLHGHAIARGSKAKSAAGHASRRSSAAHRTASRKKSK